MRAVPWCWAGILLALMACDATAPEAPPSAADRDAAAAADVEPASPLDGGIVEEADAGFEPDAAVAEDGSSSNDPDSGVAAPTDAGLPDSGAPDAAAPADSGTAAPDASSDAGPIDPGPAVLNPGWIGGPCQTHADCAYAGGECLPNASGWPGGTCSQPCDRTCPDLAGPLNSVTFCIDDGNGDTTGRCVSRCDFTLSPTGCRAGYVCLPEKRMNQASVVRHACVPLSGVPGRAPPPFDIGAACSSASDCARSTCIADLPGGYCTQESCDVVGCPAGSSCWNLGGQEQFFACLRDCTAQGQCRTGEGYACDADQTCWWTPPPAGTCNLAGAATDCSSYAARASRDFVVVSKGVRRMTLCNGTSVAGSWCIGLGSSPVLDKEREGDRRTPEGIFYVPRKLPMSQFYKAFLISYPDIADAQRGLAQGLITQAEHDAIVAAQNARREPPQNTNLGGLIEIHGGGGSSDWTWGCVAADNTVVDTLWPVIDVGDTVVILP